MEYFQLRDVQFEEKHFFSIHKSFIRYLPENKQINILDIGCGPCDMLQNLRFLGYQNLKGVDISDEAVSFGKSIKLNVDKIASIKEFASQNQNKYDFIFMMHVLEHLPKEEIIETIRIIRTQLLNPTGAFYISVPNAMSNTGCYWAYEDFTHNVLFTAGSLKYVLQKGGFISVDFIDPDNTEYSRLINKPIKQLLLKLYKWKIHFWNKVTSSTFHKPSSVPLIFGFEIRAIAK